MHNPGPEYVLREFYAAWLGGDYERSLNCFADDVVVAQYLPRDVFAFGGESQGLAELRDRMLAFLSQFELLDYRPLNIVIQPPLARAQIYFRIRHKASGQKLDGVLRQEAVIENNRITCLREYHDCERFLAFMQLATADQ